MKSLKAISFALVLEISVAGIAQKGGHGGGGMRAGGVRAGGMHHASISAPPRSSNFASGRVISPTRGYRGSYNARGAGYAPSPVATGSYKGSWGRQYENWSGSSYKGSFNFNGKHDLMQRDLDRDKNRPGGAKVRHMVGNGFGSWGEHLRLGYVGWPTWRDGDFYFNSWIFSPYGDPCAISPFYSYPWLPPYISERNIVFRPGFDFNFAAGTPYQFKPGFDNFGYGNGPLNSSITQICAIFGPNPVDAVSYIVPRDQSVGIFGSGKYMYSLSGPDFSKILIDTAHSSYTIGFGINFVRQIGDTAVVNCTQTCKLPEGGQASFEQNYELCKVKDRYVVAGFMSSPKNL